MANASRLRFSSRFFWNGAATPAQFAEVCPELGYPDFTPLYRDVPGAEIGYANRYLAVDHHNYLPDDILYKVDRMSMAHSLEVRPPLLDHRIVEFAASLPEELKIRGAAQKIVLKALMRDKLPPSLLQRKKTGFDVPAHHSFRGVLRPLLLETVTERAAADTGIFRYPGIENLIRDHSERRANVGYQLWGLLILFLWMKRWGIQAPARIAGESASVLTKSS